MPLHSQSLSLALSLGEFDLFRGDGLDHWTVTLFDPTTHPPWRIPADDA